MLDGHVCTEFLELPNLFGLLVVHTMEDIFINPLLLLGFVSVEKNQAFLFAFSGDDSDYSLFNRWSSYTMEKKQQYGKGDPNKVRKRGYH